MGYTELILKDLIFFWAFSAEYLAKAKIPRTSQLAYARDFW